MSDSFAKEIWATFSVIDMEQHTEKLNNASYVTWSIIWALIMKHYPESQYTFSDRLVEYPAALGVATVEVSCVLTIIDGERSLSHEMWLPVMQKMGTMASIENPSSRQISDSKFRCLVKSAAMFGLGLSLWSGEDIKPDPAMDRLIEFSKLKASIRMALWKTAIVIKEAYVEEDSSTALEAWRECSEEEMKLLWTAETRGGFFNTAEKTWIREFQVAESE